MRMKRVAAGVLVGALLVAGGLRWLQSIEKALTDSGTHGVAARVVSADDSHSMPSPPDVDRYPGSGAMSASPPRPPTATPLSELWATLGAAARSGHAPSACRLAIETLRCSTLLQFRADAQALAAPHASGELAALEALVNDPTGLALTIAAPAISASPESEQRNAEISGLCGTDSSHRQSEALALLRQAALAGVPDAQTVYVTTGQTLIGLPGGMADPIFERWMEEAPTVLARMLDTGHPDAPGLLADAYARDQFHGFLFPYDPVRGVAFAELARLIGHDRSLSVVMLQRRREALTPVQRGEAERLARQWYDTHYAGRLPRGRFDRRQMLDSVPISRSIGAEARDTECSAAGAPPVVVDRSQAMR